VQRTVRQRERVTLPTGTVTFLFTDIEGSTHLLRQTGEIYAAILADHHRILRNAAAGQGGREIDNQGDSFFFAFERANAAVGAAVLAQRAFAEHPWPEGAEVRVRMGLHTAEPIVGEERDIGLGVHRAARIGAVAHGGQVLLSNATRELLEGGLAGVSIRDLGSYRLRRLDRSERLYQLDVAGLTNDFPPLNAPRIEEPRAISQAEINLGAEFLGYRIEEQIGKGGMGVVYRAYDLRLKRTVALKLVTPELAVDDRFRERFARETELAMSLEHPNVVPIYDAGEVAGRLYLAMRLVTGNDLRAVLREEGALEPSRALAICRQIGNALDAAHARALVHRDVKPSNVLLDAAEHAYLADFGLTRRLEEEGSQSTEGESLGTPAYVAPEQIEGKAIDGRADVYSLGCVLFECLTGVPPYRGGSRLAVAWAHLEEAPPSASELEAGLPEAIDPVLRRALAKEAEERYPTCAALISVTEQALGIKQSTDRWRRLMLIAAAAALLAIAAFVAATRFSRGATTDPSAPVVRENTVVRIDPATNAIAAVTHVGSRPAAAAAAGPTVWVYSQSGTMTEVDARTAEVRRTVEVSAEPVDLGLLTGPVLDADADGAWLIGVDDAGRPLLERMLAGGEGTRTFPLEQKPRSVAVGEGAVWVLVHGAREDQVLRIDPATGEISARARFPASPGIDSLDVGLGAVWAVSSSTAELYKIDPDSAETTGRLDLGERAGRPYVRFGAVWVGLSDGVGKTVFVYPQHLIPAASVLCCPLGKGYDTATGFGSVWYYHRQTGTVVRFDAASKQMAASIPVTAPRWNGLCLTSIAAGGDGVWVTVATGPLSDCRTE
jgi:class 3 adenylate cyclase/DNA-binding beta-propeller fold protein YncE